jgi:hypothetical protein
LPFESGGASAISRREIEDDFVSRLNGRWFVSASSDAIYAPYRGAVRVADSVVPLADTAELCFVVGDGDEVRFFERIRHPATWSEHVRRQTEKKLQKTAARPTPQWMKPST